MIIFFTGSHAFINGSPKNNELDFIPRCKHRLKYDVTSKVCDGFTAFLVIDPFTVVCSVTWPLNGSEAGGDLVARQLFGNFLETFRISSHFFCFEQVFPF